MSNRDHYAPMPPAVAAAYTEWSYEIDEAREWARCDWRLNRDEEAQRTKSHRRTRLARNRYEALRASHAA